MFTDNNLYFMYIIEQYLVSVVLFKWRNFIQTFRNYSGPTNSFIDTSKHFK